MWCVTYSTDCSTPFDGFVVSRCNTRRLLLPPEHLTKKNQQQMWCDERIDALRAYTTAYPIMINTAIVAIERKPVRDYIKAQMPVHVRLNNNTYGPWEVLKAVNNAPLAQLEAFQDDWDIMMMTNDEPFRWIQEVHGGQLVMVNNYKVL